MRAASKSPGASSTSRDQYLSPSETLAATSGASHFVSTSKTISAAFDPKVKCSLVRAITFAPPLRSFLATIFSTPPVGTVAFGTPMPMACCGDSPPINAAPAVIVVKEATRTVPDDIQQ